MSLCFFSVANEIAAEMEAAGLDIPAPVVRLVPHMDAVLWMRARRTAIAHAEIYDRYGVSRATAYRWLKVIQGGSIVTCVDGA